MVKQKDLNDVLKELADVELELKELQDRQKELKQQVIKKMKAQELKKVENGPVVASYVAPQKTTRIDFKAFEKNEPKRFAYIKENYSKEQTKKESLRVKINL